MTQVNVSQARKNLSELIRSAEHGESITITRRGKEVARLMPPAEEPSRPLPELKDFRASLKIKGKSLSETVIEKRDEERY